MIFLIVATVAQGRIAGGDAISIEMGKWLVRRGHHVIVLTKAVAKAEWERAGLSAEYWIFDEGRLNQHGLLGATLGLLRYTVKAIVYLREVRLPQELVILPSGDMLSDIVSALSIRAPKTVRIALLHLVAPSPLRGYLGIFTGKRPRWGLDLRAGLNWAQQQLSLRLMLFYDLIVPVSPYNRRFLEGTGLRRKLAPHDLAGSMDWEAIRSISKQEKLYDACWIGRYHPLKGHSDLFKAWKIVCMRRPRSVLVLIGDVEAQLRSEVWALRLQENVVFLGYRRGMDKLRILSQSKMLVFPSYFEGRPVTIMEALGCGVPVVAYDLPVYREAFPGGMLTAPVGGAEDLARQVLSLLEDPQLQQRLADEARAVMNEEVWETSMTRLAAQATTMLAVKSREQGHGLN